MGNANSKLAHDYDFYQIECKNKSETDDTYIGSTCEWIERMKNHQRDCNNPRRKHHNLKVYKTIREFGGWDNWRIIKIDHLKKICKNDARTHEQYLMEKYGSTMNSQRAKRTEEQRREQQRIGIKKHGEKNPNYNKEWREKNPNYDKDRCEKNSATIKEKFDCEICGGKYTQRDKTKHIKTDKHKKAIKN